MSNAPLLIGIKLTASRPWRGCNSSAHLGVGGETIDYDRISKSVSDIVSSKNDRSQLEIAINVMVLIFFEAHRCVNVDLCVGSKRCTLAGEMEVRVKIYRRYIEIKTQ
jgi:hypothetical protein